MISHGKGTSAIEEFWLVGAVMGVMVWGGVSGAKAEGRQAIQEPARFVNGSVTLSGTLWKPDGLGVFPAVVLVPGTGPVTREAYQTMIDLFLRHGVAVLAHDKRGAGLSSGDWMAATLDDQAKDALAAVDWLKSRREIRADRIGLWGFSQGGWVAPLAASRSSDVAFLVLVSAPGVSPREQDRSRVREECREAGMTPAQASEAVKAWEQFVRHVRNPATDETQFPDLLEQYRKPLTFVKNYRLELLQYVKRAGIEFDFDPQPVLRRLTCPVLALYGEQDTNVPVKENLPLLEKHIRDRGGRLETHVFPGANHALAVFPDHGPRPAMGPRERWFTAPGLSDVMGHWLHAVVDQARHVKP